MATRAKKALVDDGQAVALVPIDSRGRLVEGAGSWPMPVDGDPMMPDDEQEPAPEQSSADRVMALLSEISNDERAVVKVFRKLSTGKQSWCSDYSPAEFEQGGMTMIRTSWGPGDFVIVLYGGTPYRIKSRSEVTIDARRDAEPASAGAAGTSELSQMLRQMAEGQAQMLRVITERPDPMASMTQTLAMMAAMREAMGLNNKAPEKSSIGEIVDAIKELRGAGSIIAGKEEDDDSLMGMVKQVLPGLVAAIGQAKAGGASPGAAPSFPAIAMPPSIANAGEVAPGDRPLDMPPSTEENPDMALGLTPEALTAIKLKTFIRGLCLMAKADSDPHAAAELVYEKLPDEAIDLLEMPVWWEMFKEQFPEVEPWPVWFTAVRDRVMAILAEEAMKGDDADTEPSGLPGAAT